MSDIFDDLMSTLLISFGNTESSQKDFNFSKSCSEQHDFCSPLQYWDLFSVSCAVLPVISKKDKAGHRPAAFLVAKKPFVSEVVSPRVIELKVKSIAIVRAIE